MTNHDAIVLGVGGVGSGAFHHLARRGRRVLGVDRFGIAHDRGSSHGETRIIRKAYFEHPDYVPLCERAYAAWAELEALTGRTLYHETGLLLAGPAEGEAVSGARLAAERYGVRIDNFTAGEAATRFPPFRIPDDGDVVFEPEAGYLLVEECVRAHVETGIAAGGEFVTAEVQDWNADANGVSVTLAGGDTHRARTLIVAPGAWASSVCGPELPPIRVRRKVQMWFPAPEPQLDASAGMPGFYVERPSGAFYGFPRIDGRTLKIAQHSGGDEVADAGAVDRSLHDRDVRPVAEFVAECLPGVETTPLRHAVCLYSMSPDGHFVVDRLPGHERVFVAAGLSGHGFKFTGVLGRALADLATEGRTDVPIGFLSPSRFP